MTEYVEPEGLRRKAGEFDTRVQAPLDEAATLVKGPPQDIAYPAFSMVGKYLATAYVESLNFFLADLDTKTLLLEDFKSNLEKTAGDWEAAEVASTVEEGDG